LPYYLLCLQVFYDPFSIDDRVGLQLETLAASLFVHAGRSITPLQTCHVLVIVLPFVEVTDDRGILPVLTFDKANVIGRPADILAANNDVRFFRAYVPVVTVKVLRLLVDFDVRILDDIVLSQRFDQAVLV
jgi:hypothetical protein